jgi:hypothetical protein
MQAFRNPLLVCLVAFFLASEASNGFAQNKQAEKTGQPLQSFFQQLLSKKAVVGGTVLRGDNDTTAAGSKPLLLADEKVFKVLPGSSSISLEWASSPAERWELSVAGQTVEVEGGYAKVPVPTLAAQGLHDWELKKKSSRTQLAGHWFFLQNIEVADGRELLELLKHAREESAGRAHTTNTDTSTGVQNVCDWMWSEQLVEFNEWCLQKPRVAASVQ